MRQIVNLREGWLFSKNNSTLPEVLPTDWQSVTLPHTWNAEDGFDGGNDYFRGTCLYAKLLRRSELPEVGISNGNTYTGAF